MPGSGGPRKGCGHGEGPGALSTCSQGEILGTGCPVTQGAHPTHQGLPRDGTVASSRQAPTLGMAGTAPRACPLTQCRGQEAVNQDIREAADRGGEVCVQRHVEGVVAELGWVLQRSRAEVHGHLGVRGWGVPQSWAGPGGGLVYFASLGDSPGGALGAWAHLPGVGSCAKLGGLRRPGAVPYGAGGTLGAAMGLGGVMGALAPLLLRPSVGLTQTLGIGSGVGGGRGRTRASC